MPASAGGETVLRKRRGVQLVVLGDTWAFGIAKVSARPMLRSDPEGTAPAAAEHPTVERKDA